MITWQITNQKEIGKINLTENIESVDEVKVKITQCMITKRDISSYISANKNSYPFTPCSIAVGQITDTVTESEYFSKGDKVFLLPNIDENGKNVGFLRDFAVVSKETVRVLPTSISEKDALYVYHISLALTVIDKLKIEKGDYVSIIGGSILANILAQLIMYYKAVPILIDKDLKNIEIAKKTDVYYSLLADKTTERQVFDITGGKKCKKVVYITDDNLNLDYALKMASSEASLAITGTYASKQKLDLTSAFEKKLNIKFVSDEYDNVSTGINLLVQKAINLKYFKLNDYKFDYVSTHFKNASEKLLNGETSVEFLVNLL